MRRVILFPLVFCFLFSAYPQQQESITITTYYPSPTGSFQNLFILGGIAIGDFNNDGVVNEADLPHDGAGNILPESLSVAGRVGIGTVTPENMLHVHNPDGAAHLLISGADNVQSVPPNENYSAVILHDDVIDTTNFWAIAHKFRPGETIENSLHIDYWPGPDSTTAITAMAVNPQGNVGIGTINPLGMLQIARSATYGNNHTGFVGNMWLGSETNIHSFAGLYGAMAHNLIWQGDGTVRYAGDGPAGILFLGDPDGANESGFVFRLAVPGVADTQATVREVMRIKADAGQPNGNVGIGTGDPQATLDVNGGVRIGNTTICNMNTLGTLRFFDNNTPATDDDRLQVCRNLVGNPTWLNLITACRVCVVTRNATTGNGSGDAPGRCSPYSINGSAENTGWPNLNNYWDPDHVMATIQCQ